MKRTYSAGYFSSYDRGLHVLLEMWPLIHKALPEATLNIYYGWETFDLRLKREPGLNNFKQYILKKLDELSSMGVTENGRVNHADLAKVMKEISVWLYPTEFEEINCITALKAAEAGMHQVCTRVAALSETAPNATFIESQNIYTDTKAQKDFVDQAIKALISPVPSQPPSLRYWPDIAQVWAKTFGTSI
jgi:glycosyltransferase involved in cell wall biosynthesis